MYYERDDDNIISPYDPEEYPEAYRDDEPDYDYYDDDDLPVID